MPSDSDIITRDDLPLIKPEEDKEDYLYDYSKTIDENYLEELKSCVPLKTMRMLTPAKIEIMLKHVRNGMSLSTAGSSVGIVPTTLGRYLFEGKKDYEALTDEDFEKHDNHDDALTEKAKFFLMVAQAKSECVITLQNILMDKANENGKEWIPQWLLQILEPETYSLKYRTEKMKLDAKSNEASTTVGKIEFVFIDGAESRNDEDREYIEKRMDDLERKWGKPKTAVKITDATYTVIDDEEEDSEDES